MLATGQVARWQSKYGRDPTDQQRSWLVNKIRTDSDIAMMGTKLNAQVIIKNLRNLHEKSLPPTGARRTMELELEYQDWARLQGLQPERTTHGWTFRPHNRVAVVVESRNGHDPPVDST